MPNPPQIQGSKEKGAFDPLAFLSRAGAGKTIEPYRKNQKIFSQGDVADTVFFIRNGKVKITVISEHGKEAVIGFLTEGQFFGEGCLDGRELRGATSHAVEECLITSMTKTAMLAALATSTV
jgi:CRP/FNR family transcriptional regulator, cyclic AMP receptor protein